MTAAITLAPGEDLHVRAGPVDLHVVVDRSGHVGIGDQRGCWLPPPTEGTSSYALDVIPDHPAYTDHGAGADAVREAAIMAVKLGWKPAG